MAPAYDNLGGDSLKLAMTENDKKLENGTASSAVGGAAVEVNNGESRPLPVQPKPPWQQRASQALQRCNADKGACVLRVAASWPYAVLIALLALAAGVMGSIFSEPIRSAFPFCCWVGGVSYRRAELPVFIFWGAAILWVLLFALREVAQGEAFKEAREHAENLKRVVGETKETAEGVAGKLTTAEETLSTAISGAETKLSGLVNETKKNLGKSVQEATAKLKSDIATTSQSLGILVRNTRAGIADSLSKATTKLTGAIEGSAKKLQSAVGETKTFLAEIQRSVQTLPSRDYLGAVAKFTVLAHRLMAQELPALNQARELMLYIVQLARTYDGRPSVRYAANVMRFRPNPSPAFTIAMTTLKPPLPKYLASDDLSGVLVLDMDLTVSLDGQDRRDDRVSEVAFAIPRDLTTGRALLLPGAPTAFAHERASQRPDPVAYATYDLRDVPKEMETGGAFPEDAVSRMNELFGEKSVQGRWVRSGVSIPLYEMMDTQSGGARAVGVLNVHCDKENALTAAPAEDEAYDAFIATVGHLVQMVAVSLWPPRHAALDKTPGSR